MDMNQVTFKPADPSRHFSAISKLMTREETEPTTENSLLDWYNRQRELGIHFTVAIDLDEHVLGFNGLYRLSTPRVQHFGIYLIVEPDSRGHGLGRRLYAALLVQAAGLEARVLKTWVRDDSVEGLRFATRQGFVMKRHSIGMRFDLKTWGEARYDTILQSTRAQGFHFTNMAELGDTPEARRKLYMLNSTAAATDPGSDGTPPWASFEDFNKLVCSAGWYHPDAQIIAIDTSNGEWASMSAITVFEGADHAYNLFTGTDVRYRGRKLAQAVKALALRRARLFGVDSVHTSHDSENAAMIAIDTKLGYFRSLGTLTMEKELVGA